MEMPSTCGISIFNKEESASDEGVSSIRSLNSAMLKIAMPESSVAVLVVCPFTLMPILLTILRYLVSTSDSVIRLPYVALMV